MYLPLVSPLLLITNSSHFNIALTKNYLYSQVTLPFHKFRCIYVIVMLNMHTVRLKYCLQLSEFLYTLNTPFILNVFSFQHAVSILISHIYLSKDFPFSEKHNFYFQTTSYLVYLKGAKCKYRPSSDRFRHWKYSHSKN